MNTNPSTPPTEKQLIRDHVTIGMSQDLFFFDGLSRGSPFWLPHGTIIYSTLVEYIKVSFSLNNLN
ncbi:MAG: hypothetical protein EOP45_11625 [Sphingobacteriaceae bacterium]|nr:MAG: hypothetical protein EOP45_11625 [Sphingobacteriaceae bacterium]